MGGVKRSWQLSSDPSSRGAVRGLREAARESCLVSVINRKFRYQRQSQQRKLSSNPGDAERRMVMTDYGKRVYEMLVRVLVFWQNYRDLIGKDSNADQLFQKVDAAFK